MGSSAEFRVLVYKQTQERQTRYLYNKTGQNGCLKGIEVIKKHDITFVYKIYFLFLLLSFDSVFFLYFSLGSSYICSECYYKGECNSIPYRCEKKKEIFFF